MSSLETQAKADLHVLYKYAEADSLAADVQNQIEKAQENFSIFREWLNPLVVPLINQYVSAEHRGLIKKLPPESRVSSIEKLAEDLLKIQKILGRTLGEVSLVNVFYWLSSLSGTQELDERQRTFLDPAIKVLRKQYPSGLDLPTLIDKLVRLKVGMVFAPDDVASICKTVGIDAQRDEVLRLLLKSREARELEEFERQLEFGATPCIGSYCDLDGVGFEGYLKDLFVALGYEVSLTPPSRDQGADLIVSSGDGVRTVVQAKKHSQNVSNAAVQEVVAAMGFYSAQKAIVVATSRFTQSAIDLAVANNVDLWDQIVLDDKIRQANMASGTESHLRLELDGQEWLLRGRCVFCDSPFEQRFGSERLGLVGKGQSSFTLDAVCGLCEIRNEVRISLPSGGSNQ